MPETWLKLLIHTAPRRFAAAVLLSLLAVSTCAGVVDFSPALLKLAGERWGREAPRRLLAWQESVRSQQAPADGASRRAELQLLEATNLYWNRTPYFEDSAHWGVVDYWATPVETQGSNGGDCEDYAFGKYFSLKELGVSPQKLRITYVRALRLNVSHMVLAYYPEVDADPLILDNLTNTIAPASRRTDLEPVYSFNDDDLWTPGASTKRQSSQIRLWRELLEKMAREQRL
jgi:predicted transglutaminase-like cysteine proteinase